MNSLKPFGNVIGIANNWNDIYSQLKAMYVIQRQSMSGVATIELTGVSWVIRFGD
jgi:hypothetical protein